MEVLVGIVRESIAQKMMIKEPEKCIVCSLGDFEGRGRPYRFHYHLLRQGKLAFAKVPE